jgi:hypothetical protein
MYKIKEKNNGSIVIESSNEEKVIEIRKDQVIIFSNKKKK